MTGRTDRIMSWKTDLWEQVLEQDVMRGNDRHIGSWQGIGSRSQLDSIDMKK